MMQQTELTFQKAIVRPTYDAKRLEEGKDLNDALLDFFVKLGQAVIPEPGREAPVAYLGSHFYDFLRKGNARDGADGHKNVANWAKRRLGKGGLFRPGIGALAVPINEMLVVNGYDGRQEQSQEKHWWLAMVLNPHAAAGDSNTTADEKDMSLLCLDSFVCAGTRYSPPVRALKQGTLEKYPLEVNCLARVGFNIKVFFSASGDGSSGGLPDPKTCKLRAGGRVFPVSEAELKVRALGGPGQAGKLEGSVGFRLDRRGAAKTVGQYMFEFGDSAEDYEPPMKLRMGEKPTSSHSGVANFLGGYLDKEFQSTFPSGGDGQALKLLRQCTSLPGVPQQETSHDCGFFVMEMILRSLQLTAKALRELATASSVEVAMLPWPSQKQIVHRKAMLRNIVDILTAASRKHGTGDVEVMFKQDPSLREKVKTALTSGGPSFAHGFDRWAAGDWDLSPSRSPSPDLQANGKERSKERSSRRRTHSSSSSSGRQKKKKRRRHSSSSDTRERSSSRESSSESERGTHHNGRTNGTHAHSHSRTDQLPAAQLPSFSTQDLATMPISRLRELCVKRNVLPPGLLERGDLVKVLERFATQQNNNSSSGSANASAATTTAANGTAANAAAAVGSSYLSAAPGAASPTSSPSAGGPPKAPEATFTGRFTKAMLEAMSVKELKAMCISKNVLPPPPLERTDLVQALTPFAAPF
mmetsp:Transcript_37020/g.78504  ORF Transcript_37020/g.78504 Transcript_37020/m.78504 type:complete len:697 (-) Transcript_37020:294-2384(-)